MLGKVLEELFIRIWVVIKLTLYFWIYTFVGGIIFGLGTAWKTVNELFYLYGLMGIVQSMSQWYGWRSHLATVIC